MPAIKSYAKVNLALRVYPLKPGEQLHRIDSVFALYKPLFDVVTIKPALNDRVEFKGASIGAENTVTKALQVFYKAFGVNDRYAVSVEKRIPVGAGLGGGSSNAGVVLAYLAKKHAIDKQRLCEVAVQVGSDVPFFVAGHAQARVSGHGQIVKGINTNWRVERLYLSSVQSMTSMVYRRFDNFLPLSKQTGQSINAFLAGRCLPFNDLERAYLHGRLAEKKRLAALRQRGKTALVSGSGSAIVVLVNKTRTIK